MPDLPAPALSTDLATVHLGDCLTVLRDLPDASIDAVITDPPYGLSNTDPAHVVEALTRWATGERDYVPTGRGFMGKEWDAFVPPPAVWDECLRVLKPGGHLLAFAGSRTFDLMTLSIRFAGFDIRDSIAWLYGNGFPKSLDVSKAIDKANGRVGEAVLALKARLREVFDASGLTRAEVDGRCGFRASNYLTLPAEGKRPDPWVALLPTAEKWATMRDVLGCGPALDGLFDAAEREVIGTRKVIPGVAFQTDGPDELDITAPASPAAQQWSGWGTALKPAFEPIVVARKPLVGTVAANVLAHGTGALNIDGTRVATSERMSYSTSTVTGATAFGTGTSEQNPAGRWPANVLLDGDAAAELDEQSGPSQSRVGKPRGADAGDGWGMTATGAEYSDAGGASRFFPTFRYQAKAPTRERPTVTAEDGTKTAHPTVKPLALMRWLVRLVTPPGGTVLDPFTGSGTTVEAATLEGFASIGIERDPDYLPLIQVRLDRSV